MITETVEQVAKRIGYKPMFTKSEFNHLDELLQPTERLLYMFEGLITKVHTKPINGRGIAVLTDRRVIFYRRSIIGTETKEEFKISNISAASSRKGLMYSSMMITVASNVAEIEQANKKAVEQFVQLLRDLMHQPPASTQQNFNTSSVADELKKLVELKAAGVLTEEEFQAQKAKLLN